MLTRITVLALMLTGVFAARPDSVRSPRSGGVVAVGFIGDSITIGVPAGGTLPPAELTARLLSTDGLIVHAVNQGHLGSTTADWLPRSGRNYFSEALAAFALGGVKIVHVMLGTNDANPNGAHITPSTYKANLAAISKALNAAGYIVVLSYPPYAQPNASDAIRVAMNARLRAYEPAIDALVNGTTIRRGDVHAYAYFQEHLWELADGIHPNADGIQQLARQWASALRPVVARH